MTRDELIAHCKYYKGQHECPNNYDWIFWMCEQLYVNQGEDVDGYNLYYERYKERTYRGVPYGILSRLYIFALEKGMGYADSLTAFHKWIDFYIDFAPLSKPFNSTDSSA